MPFDPFDSVLMHLMTGTRGGPNRMVILYLVSKTPRNAHDLAKNIGADYSTVIHHLEVLEKYGLVVSSGKKYGETYMLTAYGESKRALFEKIFKRLDELGKGI